MKQILLSFLFYSAYLDAQHHKGIFILIHGTWGVNSEWYQPDSLFFKAIEESASAVHYAVVPFMWSGSLDHTSRKIAGAVLAKLIQSYPSETKITIIGHSHGGNVAILASQILSADPRNNHSIEALFTLGTPVHAQDYMPNMNIIKKLYNFFSFEDKVQPIFGFFDREFPKHSGICNLRIFIDNKEPGHGQLTSELIAHWIPYIHEELAQRKIGNFEHFDFSQPGIIHFYNKQLLMYYIEATRTQALEKDRYANKLIAAAILRKRRTIASSLLSS
jgi:pimeloyl-ACP methyl ester carboxylesterase